MACCGKDVVTMKKEMLDFVFRNYYLKFVNLAKANEACQCICMRLHLQ